MASLLRTAGRARPALTRSIARPASRSAPIALQRYYASAAASAVAPQHNTPALFPDEPSGPIIRTEIPGPKSKAAVERLGKVFDTRSLNMMANYNQSYGN
jgi:4-aminobutyrate aminotransferase/(S)-3-amino-2-methylpropionate transaminase